MEDEQVGLDILKNQKVHTTINFLELWTKKYKQRKALKQQAVAKALDLARAVAVDQSKKVSRALELAHALKHKL